MIGVSFKNIEDAFNQKIPTHDKTKYLVFVISLAILGLLSVIIIIYLIIFTVRTYKKSKKILEE